MIRTAGLYLLCLAAAAFAQPNEVRKSVARITNNAEEPNYRIPWLPGATSGGSGTGWVVSGDRLMTNAHVVSNAKFLTVEKEGDPRKYIARIRHQPIPAHHPTGSRSSTGCSR